MMRILILIALIFVHSAYGFAQDLAAPIDATQLAAFVDGEVAGAMRQNNIAGVSVAVINRSQTVLTKGYGVAALAPERAAQAGTLFRVGSISKTIVWIAVMQLVEQGKIHLDDPINQHLPPALRVPDEGFAEPIRIWHLMTHTAGFEETILGHMQIDDFNHELPLATYLARYRPHRVFPPGKLAIYCNYGAALAGVIVAQVSGLPWEEYAEQRVLRPLGMQTATFREPMPRALAEARGLPQPMSPEAAAMATDGFRWQEARLEQAPPEFISHYAPAGALRASALDMATYMRALLEPERFVAAGVLSSQSVHEMLQPSFSNASGFAAIYHGFFQFPFPGPSLALGHDGDTMYQHAVMIVVPERGLGVFVAANTPSGLPLIEQLPILIGNYLVDKSAPPVADLGPRAVPSTVAVESVAGDYRWMRRAYFRTERGLLNLLTSSVETTANGDLLVSGLSGSGLSGDAVRYAPIGGGVYRELGGLNRIAFRQSGKDMILLDPTGANPLERFGFFAGTGWLLIIVLCAHLAALWGCYHLVRDVRDKGPKIGLLCGAVPAMWLAAFIVTWLGLAPWLADVHTLLMHYPGALFPVGCWMLLLAAVMTVLAIISMVIARPRMTAWRWIETSITWLVFSGCAVTLYSWGFLGFSAW